jgi:cytochrome c oxidase cbb3-type subunit 3
MAKKVKDELLDHDYDGIREFDNDLPPWWVWLFYITIGFSVVYIVRYHITGTGPSSEQEYLAEMKEGDAIRHEAMAKAGALATAFLSESKELNEGKSIYETNCVPCHGQNGEGGVGPNLTDKYWLHGNKVEDLVKTISKGYPEKGMIAWDATLKPQQILQVASYIHTMEGKNVAGKAPQGNLIEN